MSDSITPEMIHIFKSLRNKLEKRADEILKEIHAIDPIPDYCDLKLATATIDDDSVTFSGVDNCGTCISYSFPDDLLADGADVVGYTLEQKRKREEYQKRIAEKNREAQKEKDHKEYLRLKEQFGD